MIEKSKSTSGADEKTPSKSEYFSWINNTNEGSTEQQTLINLDFFKYLYDTYGMQLDIYAWDAGNLDGANGTYEFIDGEKLTKQYPSGYVSAVEKAKQIGTRMGVWGGADGYGETEEDIAKRRNMLVKLCKDYNWALFKFDTVCGNLRENMRKEFAKTMQECRKYCPDLILLNHRNDLGEAEVYATTFLWEGVETYTDVHVYNTITAPHNRAYIFSRGRTPQNKRLTEDHGVCISSSIDFFEDDLVYQAFNRCLILAPEIYGNPWLMRDDELSKLAYIFNLHRKYRNILVEGFPLGEAYGENAFVRGDGQRRFLSTGNASWCEREICVALNEEIGLKRCKEVQVCLHFPYEKYVGTFPYGSIAKVVMPPFRAVLVEVCNAQVATPVLTNCTYNLVCEKGEKSVNILSADGKIQLLAGGKTEDVSVSSVEPFDISLANPVKLGSLSEIEVPQNAEQLYEFACFGVDNDSLEYRSLLRSGKTEIPQVQRARDAFFRQESYRLRGLETSIPFDGNPHTVFDTKSRLFEIYHGKGYRCRGGCLRVDFGKTFCADRLEIEFFDGLQNPPHVFAPQIVQNNLETSCDLATWQQAPLVEVQDLGQYDLRYFDYYIDKPTVNNGLRKKAVFAISGEIRYFRMPEQVDRIFSIKAFSGGKQVLCPNAHLTNLFAPYYNSTTKSARQGSVKLPKDLPLHPYIAVAVEGTTGNEGVTCVAEIDGKLVAFPNRAPAYPANVYECYVRPVDGFYTFFLPVLPQWQGKEMRITVSFIHNATPVDVYLCDANKLRNGVVATVSKL